MLDPRTHSIRLFHNRNFAISFDNASHHVGNNAVVRPWKNHPSQEVFIHKNQFRVGKKKVLCLEFQSNKLAQNLHWWKCQKKKDFQKFVIHKVKPSIARELNKHDADFNNEVLHSNRKVKFGKFKNHPGDNHTSIDKIEHSTGKVKKFFIRIKTHSKSTSYNVIMTDRKLGDDYVAQLARNIFDDRAWFVYDYDTHTIRLASNPEWVMANERGHKAKPGKTIVFTKFDEDSPEQFIRVGGKKIKNKTGKCLTPRNHVVKDRNTLEFWICSSRKTQNW